MDQEFLYVLQGSIEIAVTVGPTMRGFATRCNDEARRLPSSRYPSKELRPIRNAKRIGQRKLDDQVALRFPKYSRPGIVISNLCSKWIVPPPVGLAAYSILKRFIDFDSPLHPRRHNFRHRS